MEKATKKSSGFSTPPRHKVQEFFKAIETDMPLAVIKGWSNLIKREEGRGYLQDYSPLIDSKYLIPTYRYDGKNWAAWDLSNEDVIQDTVTSLSFYTQNVWFSNKNEKERYANLTQMIWESNADFVCLQEVIMPFLKHLLQNDHIANTYYISTTNIEEYGVMMLSKWPVYFLRIPIRKLVDG